MTQDNQLSRLLAGLRLLGDENDRLKAALREHIAVVGLGIRFPGRGEFWEVLSQGLDTTGEVPKDRWDAAAFHDPDWTKPGHICTKRGAFLTRVDEFDAAFFRISPAEAIAMDPQQRLALECAFEGFQSAGIPLSQLRGSKTGVFLGVSTVDYQEIAVEALSTPASAHVGTGTSASVIAGRLAYAFDLRGPALTVDTACSSSLVALHLACSSLRDRTSDVAIAGGANVMASARTAMALSQLGALSSDGRSKSFDAQGDGYGRGEGCGVVILKRLSDAVRDGDRIFALIRGSAVNQDGTSAGLTAPSGASQVDVVRSALAAANLTPGDVQYIEAHGTGTVLGDPIEVEALSDVFGASHTKSSPLAIGSVKSNIGHLEGAAGISGLIKTILSIQHRELPASLHFKTPNPHIPWEHIPLRVQTKLGPWPEPDKPLIAGVSSFGFSGTNAHVVVSEPPQEAADAWKEADRLASEAKLLPLCISAKTPEALRAYADRFAEHLGIPLKAPATWRDESYTSSVRQTHLEHRLVVVGSSRAEWRDKLVAYARAERPGELTSAIEKAVFVFSGQGTPWWGMGRELLEREPVFRQTVEECVGYIARHASFSLLEELRKDEATSRLHRTDIAQPALVALQMGLVRLLASWGVEPSAVVGHSIGEVSAACTAGVLSLEQACELATVRGRVMHKAHGAGKMASVRLSAERADAVMRTFGQLEVGAYNGPESVVLSGEPEAVSRAVETLSSQGVETKELRVDYAFHSGQMEAFMGELGAALKSLNPSPSRIPLVSTLTGKVEGASYDGAYWVRQMREPVRFAQAIETLLAREQGLFVEVGPHPVLLASIDETAVKQSKLVKLVPTLRRTEDQARCVLEALGTLHGAGYPVDWAKVLGSAGRVVSLPSYPWQRKRFWLSSQGDASTRRPRASVEGAFSHDGPPQLEASDVRAQALKVLDGLLGSSRTLPPDASLSTAGLDSLAITSLRRALIALPGGRQFIQQLRGTTPVSTVFEFVHTSSGGGSSTPHHILAPDLIVSLLAMRETAEWTPVTPQSVNKRSADNVLLSQGTIVHLGAEQFGMAEIRFAQSHPFFYERPMDHVPGLFLIEAARQLGNWLTWRIVGELAPGGTWDAAEASFLEFVEHDDPAYLIAKIDPDRPLNAHLLQSGRLKGILSSTGRRIKRDEYMRLRENQRGVRDDSPEKPE